LDNELDSSTDSDNSTEPYDTQFLVAALLVFVAKGDGTISDRETDKMLSLVGEHFGLSSAACLALLTRATAELVENAQLTDRLRELGPQLHDSEKVDIAVMLLNVVAADGRKDASEMEYLRIAGEVMGISPDGMHQAFDRYFSETWT
jgi:uncharacterized tellurite resistance protein B-like protein